MYACMHRRRPPTTQPISYKPPKNAQQTAAAAAAATEVEAFCHVDSPLLALVARGATNVGSLDAKARCACGWCGVGAWLLLLDGWVRR